MSHAAAGDDEGLGTMKEKFTSAEAVINDIESGRFALNSLQAKIEQTISLLEKLTTEVSTLCLFSSNEVVEELPTSSLPFLLLPCYLGVLHHNFTVDIERKSDELNIAKVYYRDFLKRIKEYGVINVELPFAESEDNSEDLEGSSSYMPKSGVLNGKPAMTGEDHRKAKIMRYKMQRDFQAAMNHARTLYNEGKGDESYLREMYLSQLQYWAIKIMEELQSIEAELPLLEMVKKRRVALAAGENPQPVPAPPIPLKPFTITRNEEEKKVFGLGYPSAPTMTVNEWYSKRFANAPAPNQGANLAAGDFDQHAQGPNEECSSGSDTADEDDAGRRLEQLRFDEYKDTHRRGWGNTHNKG